MSASAQTPSTSQIFGLAWPLAINGIMLHGILVIDTALVSFLGEEALAAMALATSIAGLMVGLLHALTRATQILVSQAYGAGNKVALKTALGSGLVICFAMALLGIAIIVLFGGRIISSLAPSAEIASAATSYLGVFVVVILAESVSQNLSCLFNGTGRTRQPFYSHLIEVPVNVFVSAALIFGYFGFPELGLLGAAIGSASAAVVRMVFLSVCYTNFYADLHKVEGWEKGAFFPSLKYQFWFALPIAITFSSSIVAASVCIIFFSQMSINQFAAMSVIAPWINVVSAIVMAWAQATGIFVGQLLGRRIPEEDLDRFFLRSWKAAMGLSFLASLFHLVASYSYEWLYPELQAETRAAIWSFLPILMVLNFPKTSNAMCGHTLRAGGDTVYVMNIFLVTQWLLRVPLTAIFILYLELSVIWVFALYLIEELAKFPAFHLRLLSGKWKSTLSKAG